MARVQISIDDDVLAIIDDYAKANGMSRSGLFTLGAKEYVDARRKLPLITGMFSSFAELVDRKANGLISDEDFKAQLSLFEKGVSDFEKK